MGWLQIRVNQIPLSPICPSNPSPLGSILDIILGQWPCSPWVRASLVLAAESVPCDAPGVGHNGAVWLQRCRGSWRKKTQRCEEGRVAFAQVSSFHTRRHGPVQRVRTSFSNVYRHPLPQIRRTAPPSINIPKKKPMWPRKSMNKQTTTTTTTKSLEIRLQCSAEYGHEKDRADPWNLVVAPDWTSLATCRKCKGRKLRFICNWSQHQYCVTWPGRSCVDWDHCRLWAGVCCKQHLPTYRPITGVSPHSYHHHPKPTWLVLGANQRKNFNCWFQILLLCPWISSGVYDCVGCVKLPSSPPLPRWTSKNEKVCYFWACGPEVGCFTLEARERCIACVCIWWCVQV